MKKTHFCAMADCSRNAVMKPEKVKEFATYLKKLGYDSLMLYTEDTYEVDGEPYFGYFRGRYGKEELKDADAYLKSIGMELIPCVQTLAHLKNIFRWGKYCEIRDAEVVLLCGNERTYTLIDNMFKTISECFSSKTVHIGMDEAFFLGLGKYLAINGYEERTKILLKHLEKVCEIAKKHGLKPIMWSDMFFRLANGGEYYPKEGEEMRLNADVKELIPEDLGLVYWDYYHTDEKVYDKMFKGHNSLTDNVWFAGGLWTWAGFCPVNEYAKSVTKPAMISARENGAKNVIMTLWGDNGGECSMFSVLPTLFYAKKIYDGETDEKVIKKEFFDLTGENYDDMLLLSLPNEIVSCPDRPVNPCKYVLYTDLFASALSTTFPDGGAEKYAEYAEKLRNVKSKNFGYLFDYTAKLCDVLSAKYTLHSDIRKGYEEKDKGLLESCVKRIDECIVKLEAFYKSFETVWFKERKQYGFDVQDVRLGGLEKRMTACKERLEKYLDGELDKIDELEEKLLDFLEKGEPFGKKAIIYNGWASNVTHNNI